MKQMKGTDDYGAPADQFDWGFVDGMVRAMAMSFHKYGHMRTAAEDGVDLVLALEQRLALYKETGNRAHLIDVGNFAMIEFAAPSQENTFLEHEDSDKSPGVPVKTTPSHLQMELGLKPGTKQIHGKH